MPQSVIIGQPQDCNMGAGRGRSIADVELADVAWFDTRTGLGIRAEHTRIPTFEASVFDPHQAGASIGYVDMLNFCATHCRGKEVYRSRRYGDARGQNERGKRDYRQLRDLSGTAR